jgi:hypothetical protein
LRRHAAPVIQEARRLHQPRTALAQAHHACPPASSRLSAEFAYGAASWAQPWRVILKAEVMAAGDNPRFVVTSLAAPTPPGVSEDIYCARGTCANHIRAVQCALHSDRTSATTFLANAMRLLLACAASVLHHARRTHPLPQTALAQAQPSTVILTLCKVATQVKQYKDRILLHLPSACPVKALRHRVTALRSLVPLPALNTSCEGLSPPHRQVMPLPRDARTRRRDVEASLKGDRASMAHWYLSWPRSDHAPGGV